MERILLDPVLTPLGKKVVDFYLPDPEIALECHSRRWHGFGRVGPAVRRDRAIRGLGLEVLYFDWDDVVVTDRLTEREIRDAVDRRMAER